MEQKTIFNGHTISYNSSMAEGVRYLVHILSAPESKVFFDEAYNRGSAMFKDHQGYNYKLVHNGSEYQLTRV